MDNPIAVLMLTVLGFFLAYGGFMLVIGIFTSLHTACQGFAGWWIKHTRD